MKIAPRFSLKLNFFDFTSLRQGQFLQMTEKNKGKSKEKRFNARIHRDFFSLRSKIGSMTLIGSSRYPNSKSKGKMALASLVSSQKQKRTIVKIFLKSDTKSGFSEGGNNRTFIVSLVDTR